MEILAIIPARGGSKGITHKIKKIGLRQGEKMKEILLTESEKKQPKNQGYVDYKAVLSQKINQLLLRTDCY